MNADLPTIGHVLHRLDRAGAEVLAADLARRLRDRYNFVFLCLDGDGSLGDVLDAEGFHIEVLGRRPGVDLRTARQLRWQSRRYRIDLLHAHQYTPFTYAAMSRWLGTIPPILFTEHGRHYPDWRKPKRVFANRWLIKPDDRVTAVGRFVKQALVDNEGIAEKRIEVIYNGIDPDAFPLVTKDTRYHARLELGLDNKTPLIMQVARFHPVKDHMTGLTAFARLSQEMPTAKLCLIGDGELKQDILEQAEAWDLSDKVLSLGMREDVNTLLPAADVFMLSSVSEGVSVTLLEAMATGLPIAATDVGGNPEVIEHDTTGLLSPRGDDEALAVSLYALLRDEAKRKAFGMAGRERLLEHFTQDRMHTRYAEMYQKMLGAGVGWISPAARA